MAKMEFVAEDVKEQISEIELYRSGWSNDIREGWYCSVDGAKEINFQLYEISGAIILALQQVLNGHYRDKCAMLLVKEKLNTLIHSDSFKAFRALSRDGVCHVVTNGTKHHIRVMLAILEFLTNIE